MSKDFFSFYDIWNIYSSKDLESVSDLTLVNLKGAEFIDSEPKEVKYFVLCAT